MPIVIRHNHRRHYIHRQHSRHYCPHCLFLDRHPPHQRKNRIACHYAKRRHRNHHQAPWELNIPKHVRQILPVQKRQHPHNRQHSNNIQRRHKPLLTTILDCPPSKPKSQYPDHRHYSERHTIFTTRIIQGHQLLWPYPMVIHALRIRPEIRLSVFLIKDSIITFESRLNQRCRKKRRQPQRHNYRQNHSPNTPHIKYFININQHIYRRHQRKNHRRQTMRQNQQRRRYR